MKNSHAQELVGRLKKAFTLKDISYTVIGLDRKSDSQILSVNASAARILGAVLSFPELFTTGRGDLSMYFDLPKGGIELTQTSEDWCKLRIREVLTALTG